MATSEQVPPFLVRKVFTQICSVIQQYAGSAWDELKHIRLHQKPKKTLDGRSHDLCSANVHFSFGPLCQYLSVSYLDRGLSAYEIPNGKAWTMQLLAVACLPLAAKIKEINVPLYLDLQVAGLKNVFEAIEKEMCKFLDLLFNDSFLVEQKYVITTEVHPLPVLSSWQDRLLASKLTGLQSRSCFYQSVY